MSASLRKGFSAAIRFYFLEEGLGRAIADAKCGEVLILEPS